MFSLLFSILTAFHCDLRLRKYFKEAVRGGSAGRHGMARIDRRRGRVALMKLAIWIVRSYRQIPH